MPFIVQFCYLKMINVEFNLLDEQILLKKEQPINYNHM